MRKKTKVRKVLLTQQSYQKVKLLDRRFRAKTRHMESLLVSFYGMDQAVSDRLCAQVGVLFSFSATRLPLPFWSRIEREIDGSYWMGRPYEKEKKSHLMELKKIGSYRGLRLSQGLPMRGQRTHTNARTMKRFYRKDVSKKKKK